ncbi:hypothetical protein LTR53_000107 [Teratosphaeriaceae sp. CCFEE 6253]|nr:hypothetical protein LTR53_000107 [Teratosphaeriaceae sp. CCFEE 6253]
MPRAHVYGKRSRAVCNNFAIFDSPQRPTTLKPSIAEERETQRLVEKVTGRSLDDYARDVAETRRRSILGELHVNAVARTAVPVPKNPRRPKAKRVVALEEVAAVKAADGGTGGGLHDDSDHMRTEQYQQKADPQALDVEWTGTETVEARRITLGSLDAEAESAEARQLEVYTSPAPLPGAGPADLVEVVAEQHAVQQLKDDQDEVCAELMSHHGEIDLGAAHTPPFAETTSPIGESPEDQPAALTVDDTPDVPPSSPPASDVYSRHCSQLLELSSHRLTHFEPWADLLTHHFSLTKIAEASYGEVYRLSLHKQLPGLSVSDESVFKVIALQAPSSTLPTAKKQRAAALKRAEAMSKPDDVANEVKLLQRMSSIPGFTNFRDVRVLQGRPPPLFVDAFKRYNAEQKAKRKDLSHFPDPGKKASYGEDQLWAVIEMQDAGTDLERYVEGGECTSVWNVWDVFWQVVLSLAKGEEGAQFEHRDLHLGNICVRQCSDGPARSRATIDTKRKLGFTTLETTIIDYTISRCFLSASHSSSKKEDKDTDVAYQDLALSPYLFEGDSTEEYQYDIYRYMRGAVFHSDPLSTNPDPPPKQRHRHRALPPWRAYTPITNLVWLHYLLHQLLESLAWPSADKAPTKKLRAGAAHAEWKRANDLEHTLLRVQKLLDPETGLCKNGLRSATDVVGLALTEGWLDVVDVVGGDGGDRFELEAEAIAAQSAVTGSDGLVDQLTHLVIDVIVMEEQGLEAAEKEARGPTRRGGVRQKV